ncbi:hypothetical protein ACFL96_03030 [Thermoproteota archaeon]
MTLFKLQGIPVIDVSAVIAGGYLGYCEGKGIDTGVTLEYAAKYGPAVLTTALTPLVTKCSEYLFDCGLKSYKNLNLNQNDPNFEKTQETIKSIEETISGIEYLRPTIRNGCVVASETFLGYVFGRMISQIDQFIS